MNTTRVIWIAAVALVATTVTVNTWGPASRLHGPSEALARFGEAQSGDAGAQAIAAEQRLLNQYCITCHNERVRTAGLALDAMNIDAIGPDAEVWESVVRKLRTGMMPPAGMPRPVRAALDELASTLEARLDRAAASAPHAGSPSLHRLNRTEYANAIRDLLALDVDVTTLLPADDASEGFDNIADVLGVSPALMQGYISAATKISRQAVGDLEASPARITYRSPPGLSQAEHLDGMPVGTRGGLRFTHTFPLDGEYEFRIAGGGARGAGPGIGRGNASGLADALEVMLNDAPLQLPAGRGGGPVRFAMKAGPQTISVTLVPTSDSPGVDEVYSVFFPSGGVQSVTIIGPFDPTGPGNTPSRERIFVCHPEEDRRSREPQAGGAPASDLACATEIVRTLAQRAFRRPVAADDPHMQVLLDFYRAGREEGDFETGIQHALARVLVDPQFLFRFEHEPAGVPAGATYRLRDIELASRLSFFLWSSIPDDELLAVAAGNQLSDPAVLEQQVRRMLADPRSRSLVSNFAGQWLQLRALKDVQPDTRDFNENLRQAFQRETELLFESVMREDRSLIDLLTADYTFVDERLARHYGIAGVRGSRFRRVTLGDEARHGLLGHGSVLTVTSVADRTSPVVRGKWILENLLGTPAPVPPPNVEGLLDAEAARVQGLSVRQRLQRHRENPVCASCHTIMDPIGFALENFDLVGKWRNEDGSAPVDASGELVDGTPLDGPASLRRALVDRSDAFVTTATEKLLTYAVGRAVHYYDMPAVRTIVGDAAREDYRFSALVLGVVRSQPFQMRTKS